MIKPKSPFVALLSLAVLSFLAASRPVQAADAGDYWVEPMRAVHAKFTGEKGTFAHFGDSITVTLAYWTPLLYTRKNAPPEMEQAFARVKAYLRPECWRDWKGPEYGSQGGMTVNWAIDNVDAWLTKLHPETALIMFGTNDLHEMEVDEYQKKMRTVVQKCLDNGTVVILSTIPPRHGFETKAATFVGAIRQIAHDMKVPLIDFYAEILKRRPDDWDGQLDKFKEYKDYDVPTLISRDGTHPSLPTKYQDDYSEEGLKNCGYGLRSYLTLMQYNEVLQRLYTPNAAINNPAQPGTTPAAQPVPGANRPPAGGAASDTQPVPQDRTHLNPPFQPWFPKAPALPPPGADALRVHNPDELYHAAAEVKPGGVILVEDGFYDMPHFLEIKTDGVTLRGASGHRERVILDGSHTHGELIWVTRSTGVTIADLTVQNVKWNGIKLNSETGVQKLTIHNCILHNIWQRCIKGVGVPEQDRERLRPKECRVQYCLFYNDRPKAFSDDSTDTEATFQGDYIGGIDVMYARGWVISDNVFVGIHGRTAEARGAVFLWQTAQDCVVERNIIIDCDSGICLGNSLQREDHQPHCTGVIVRNNFITRAHENGILADYTKDCKIVNNTVYDPDSRLGRLIRIVHDADGLVVANNLIAGPPIRVESTSKITLTHNLEGVSASYLADPKNGNLHLTADAAGAIHKALPMPEVKEDIDRHPRGPAPDIGAAQAK